MATIMFKKGDDYALKLAKLADRSEETVKRAIYAGAKVMTDEVRKNLRENLKDPTYAGTTSAALFKNLRGAPTGDLERSLGITPITLGRDGFWNAKIGFDGYDSRGVPNQLKARVMESGSSTIRKRPFVRPAVATAQKRVLAAMGQVIDEEIEKNMK